MLIFSYSNIDIVYIDFSHNIWQPELMTKRKQFHHGNLRSALIEAGHNALNTLSWDKISLRGLAADAGVAPSSIYNHFKNKDSLLKELIDDGFEELLHSYQLADELKVSPKQKLQEACFSYLRFSEKRQGLFRLVFEGNIGNISTKSGLGPSMEAFSLFQKLVIACAPQIKPEKHLEAAIACWSMIHGFACLNCHSYFPSSTKTTDLGSSVVTAAINIPSHFVE